MSESVKFIPNKDTLKAMKQLNAKALKASVEKTSKMLSKHKLKRWD